MTEIHLLVVTHLAAFAGGVGTYWIQQQIVRRIAQHEVRLALRGEMEAGVLTLNFFILEAIEAHPNDAGLELKHFGGGVEFPAFDHYWNGNRGELLRLPEWFAVKGWYEEFLGILTTPYPPLFTAVMLLERLCLPHLSKMTGRDMKRTIRHTLGRRDVQQYRTEQFALLSQTKT